MLKCVPITCPLHVQPCCGSLWVCVSGFVSHHSQAGRDIGQPGQAGGERPAGRAPSLAAHRLPLSHWRAESRLSRGDFCTGISQMSRGLTVLIKHLENLAGSLLHYPWCSRMLSGVLPLLSLLSKLLSSSMSPCAHPGETLTLGPERETALPKSGGPGVSFNHQTLYGHHKVVGRSRWDRKSSLRGNALLVELCCVAWSSILECPRGKLHVSAQMQCLRCFLPGVGRSTCSWVKYLCGFPSSTSQAQKTTVSLLWDVFTDPCPHAAPKP